MDSKKNWTPEPWAVNDVKIEDRHGFLIALVYEMPDRHLIGAAPDLYAALDAVLELENNTPPFGGEMQEDRINRTIEAARKALAKARGEVPA